MFVNKKRETLKRSQNFATKFITNLVNYENINFEHSKFAFTKIKTITTVSTIAAMLPFSLFQRDHHSKVMFFKKASVGCVDIVM